MELTKGALVLEGGGMRGAFTAGVLDWFLDKGIMFDNIYGVSIGACHACSYISCQRGRAFSVVADYINDPRYMGVKHLILTGDLFPAEFVYHKIPDELYPFDYETFENYKGRFFAVLTDCRTGKAEYIQVKDLRTQVDTVRASASLPVFSRMVEIDGREYLDGGMADSIPVKKALADGNKKIVAVLTRDEGYVKAPSKAYYFTRAFYPRHKKLSEAIKTRHIMYNDAVRFTEEQESKGNVFVIRPPKGSINIGRLERDRAKLEALYEKGYAAAEESGERLAQYLGKEEKNENYAGKGY